jgi:hypothetical protein
MGENYGKYWDGNSWLPNTIDQFGIPVFIPFAVSPKCLNYIAHRSSYHINFPINFCASKDYKKPISITNRNNSKRIRTFAGNDIIYDTGSNTSASIDGGAGTDTLVYSEIYGNYEIVRSDSIITIKNKISGIIDTVRNMEIIRFKDKEIVL